MKRTRMIMLVGVVFGVTAATHAQTKAPAGAQANDGANVSAGKQGARASGTGAVSSSASAQAEQNSAALSSGTAFNAELTAPVDSRKAKPGDPVKGKTTEPCKSNGKTVLPKGTQLVGHVTEASARANGQADSALGIVFDKAVLKNGQEVPLNVAIQALASGESPASAGVADVEPMGGASAGATGAPGGRGTLGGVTSTTGAAVGSVTSGAANTGNLPTTAANTAARTTTNAAGSAGATTGNAVGGLSAAGQLTSNSRGVFGLNGLNLTSSATNATQGSVITSAGKNVHLDSGTRMLLAAQSAAGAGATN